MTSSPTRSAATSTCQGLTPGRPALRAKTAGVAGRLDAHRKAALARDERVREEQAGKVRWLRPDYQIPRFAKGTEAPAPELALPAAANKATAAPKPAWPAHGVEQIGAIKDALAAEPLTAAEVATRFEGARADLIRRHIETLALMGEVREETGGRYLASGVTV